LEFDSTIEALAIDPSASCILIGTQGGILHFVTTSGTLVLSHRVQPSKSHKV
jgi:hypothetical protein